MKFIEMENFALKDQFKWNCDVIIYLLDLLVSVYVFPYDFLIYVLIFPTTSLGNVLGQYMLGLFSFKPWHWKKQNKTQNPHKTCPVSELSGVLVWGFFGLFLFFSGKTGLL